MQWEVSPVGLAVVFLIVLLIIAVVVVPLLARVFRDAANRNPNTPQNREDENRR